ncbi:MAG: hypothetical protein AAF443_08930, partial [Chlamydiota bacterium]
LKAGLRFLLQDNKKQYKQMQLCSKLYALYHYATRDTKGIDRLQADHSHQKQQLIQEELVVLKSRVKKETDNGILTPRQAAAINKALAEIEASSVVESHGSIFQILDAGYSKEGASYFSMVLNALSTLVANMKNTVFSRTEVTVPFCKIDPDSTHSFSAKKRLLVPADSSAVSSFVYAIDREGNLIPKNDVEAIFLAYLKLHSRDLEGAFDLLNKTLENASTIEPQTADALLFFLDDLKKLHYNHPSTTALQLYVAAQLIYHGEGKKIDTEKQEILKLSYYSYRELKSKVPQKFQLDLEEEKILRDFLYNFDSSSYGFYFELNSSKELSSKVEWRYAKEKAVAAIFNGLPPRSEKKRAFCSLDCPPEKFDFINGFKASFWYAHDTLLEMDCKKREQWAFLLSYLLVLLKNSQRDEEKPQFSNLPTDQIFLLYKLASLTKKEKARYRKKLANTRSAVQYLATKNQYGFLDRWVFRRTRTCYAEKSPSPSDKKDRPTPSD